MLFKPCVQFRFRIQQPIIHNKCDQLSHAMSDFCASFNPYFQYLPSNVGVWFAPNIFVETCKPALFTFTFCYHVVQNIGVLWVEAYGHPDSGCTVPLKVHIQITITFSLFFNNTSYILERQRLQMIVTNDDLVYFRSVKFVNIV